MAPRDLFGLASLTHRISRRRHGPGTAAGITPERAPTSLRNGVPAWAGTRTERSLRHSVLGRKNFYGSKTINGADVAADHYTIIETCKLLQLDPAAYYRYLVTANNHGESVMSPFKYVHWLYEQKKAREAAAAESQRSSE
jgi:hypothetical protein